MVRDFVDSYRAFKVGKKLEEQLLMQVSSSNQMP